MWIKRITSFLLVVGFVMLVSWPWTLGTRIPEGRQARLDYSRRMVTYVGVLALVMVGAGIGALLVVRQAKQDYRRLAGENLRHLIESVDEDSKKHG